MAAHQIYVLAGLFVAFIGILWGLVLAFRTTVWWGVAYLFVPLGWPIFLLGHFRQTWKPTVMILLGAAVVGVGIVQTPPPAQLTTSQAKGRRTEVATVEQQRQSQVAKTQAELQECQTTADRRCIELTQKRASTDANDKQAVAAFNLEVSQYNALLEKIKTIKVELDNYRLLALK